MNAESRPRVLIIDDDPALRAALRGLLERAGLAVAEAGDAAQGLSLAQRGRPAVVVTDVMMPGFGTGLDALRCLRAAAATQALPVVVLSGALTDEKLAALAEPGRTWAFRKPPAWNDLVATICRAAGCRPPAAGLGPP